MLIFLIAIFIVSSLGGLIVEIIDQAGNAR
jgi:hypothetical protein